MNRTLHIIRIIAVALAMTLGVVASAAAQRHLPPGGGTPPPPAPSPKALAGQAIFFDTSLSIPRGLACASCHDPGNGWVDVRSGLDPVYTPTSEGAVAGRFGPRNSLTLTYADRAPDRFYDAASGAYIGGRYRDGRAASAQAQAKLPFMNPLEMNNHNVRSVVTGVKKSPAGDLVEKAYGPRIWRDPQQAFDAIAECLAEFETLDAVNAYSSRYDDFLNGDTAALTPPEQAGRMLFLGKGGCTACHAGTPGPGGTPPLFTTWRYYNLGAPANPHNPFYDMPAWINPDGLQFVDKGLGGALGLASEEGKFKVPTLRNVALTGPYMHNGVFTTLTEVVQFHNTRDVDGRWGPAEVPVNVAIDATRATLPVGSDGTRELPPGDDPIGQPPRLGNLGLSPMEVDEIVAFLGALTDRHVATP